MKTPALAGGPGGTFAIGKATIPTAIVAPPRLNRNRPLASPHQPPPCRGGARAAVLGPLRQPTEAEIAELRAVWWRQRRLGFALPAEPGVILFDGAASHD